MAMIKQYLRFWNDEPMGVMLGDVIDGKLTFGWSVVHPKDRFSKKKGDMIAFNRLHSDKHKTELIVPDVMFDGMQDFMLRCQKYFHIEAKQYLINGYALAVNLSHAKKHENDNATTCECVDCDCCDERETE